MREPDGPSLNAALDRRPVDERYCPTCTAYQPLAMNEKWRIRCERSRAASGSRALCGCRKKCGDVSEKNDDPRAVCKGLSRLPDPHPFVELVLRKRREVRRV
jgi:hypothetical protein